jgi:L-lysine cyclodeaminase
MQTSLDEIGVRAQEHPLATHTHACSPNRRSPSGPEVLHDPEALIIGQDDLVAIIEACGRDTLMDLMIDRLQEALVDATRGKGNRPARDGFTRRQGVSGVLGLMPHHEPGRSVTVKMVAYTPRNPGVRDLPTILAAVVRFDDITGHLVAVSDGVLLTALRPGRRLP